LSVNAFEQVALAELVMQSLSQNLSTNEPNQLMLWN